MVDELHKRPSSSQSPSEESLTSKKTKAPSSSSRSSDPMSMVVVKPEPGEAAQLSGRGRAAAAAEEQTSPAVERAQFNVRLLVHLFHCDVDGCYGYLNPPVFMCEAGHLLCDPCRADGHYCLCCNRAAAFLHCPGADRFVHGATVPCPYEAAGCNTAVLYHSMPAHREACAYAPCPCLAPGCAFSAAPPQLQDHLACAHGWPVSRLPSYAKPHTFRLPAEESLRLLAVDGDALCVFLLCLRWRTTALGVSVSCVRASPDATGPQFKCSIWATAPPPLDAARQVERRLFMETDVDNCAVAGGPALEDGMWLDVVQEMLLRPSRDVVLRIRIDEIRQASTSGARSANASR